MQVGVPCPQSANRPVASMGSSTSGRSSTSGALGRNLTGALGRNLTGALWRSLTGALGRNLTGALGRNLGALRFLRSVLARPHRCNRENPPLLLAGMECEVSELEPHSDKDSCLDGGGEGQAPPSDGATPPSP